MHLMMCSCLTVRKVACAEGPDLSGGPVEVDVLASGDTGTLGAVTLEDMILHMIPVVWALSIFP